MKRKGILNKDRNKRKKKKIIIIFFSISVFSLQFDRLLQSGKKKKQNLKIITKLKKKNCSYIFYIYN